MTSVIAANRTKKLREAARLAVRSQAAPDGELMVDCYLAGKGKAASKGYESWMVTEVEREPVSEWRAIRVRVDAPGQCRFDLGWNGERLAASKSLAELEEKHPRLAKIVQTVLVGMRVQGGLAA
jgi:hypothetical protein